MNVGTRFCSDCFVRPMMGAISYKVIWSLWCWIQHTIMMTHREESIYTEQIQTHGTPHVFNVVWLRQIITKSNKPQFA